ncbi:hypothetical protein V8D89_005691 [Ganoderma adspersum]
MIDSASALKNTGTMSPEELAKWLPLDKTFGAFLLGTFLGLILYGLIIQQAYRYYRTFQSDDSFIRLLVAVVLAFETLHTALTMYLWYCYYYPRDCVGVAERRHSYDVLIACYGDLSHALSSGGPWSLNPWLKRTPRRYNLWLIGVKIPVRGTVCELRLKSHRYSSSLWVLSYAETAVVPGVRIRDSHIISIWLLSAPVGLSFIADSVLTITLLSVLRHSGSELAQTNTFFGLVVIFVVNTGQDYFIGNNIMNALGLAFTIGDYNRSTLFVLFFGTISTRVYATSFLLNSRDALAGKQGLEVVSDGSGSYAGLGLIARAHRQAAAETWNVPQAPEPERTINVQITTELEEWEKHERRRDSQPV